MDNQELYIDIYEKFNEEHVRGPYDQMYLNMKKDAGGKYVDGISVLRNTYDASTEYVPHGFFQKLRITFPNVGMKALFILKYSP